MKKRKKTTMEDEDEDDDDNDDNHTAPSLLAIFETMITLRGRLGNATRKG